MKSLSLLLPLLLAVSFGVHAQQKEGALDEYVRRPDPAYGWQQYHRSSDLLAKNFFLKLTSQQWLDKDRVDRTLWEHELKISQPRPLFCGRSARESTTAVLIISGGKNRPDGKLS